MTLDTIVAKQAPMACKGILLALGMSGAVVFGVAIDSPFMSPFAAFGTMIAMNITPRHGVKARIAGALAGCLFLLFAAGLSVIIAGIHWLELLLLFFFSWLAALPKKDLLYLGFVAKCAAAAVLLSYFDFTPSLAMGVYFCSGIIFGIFLSVVAMAFEPEDQKEPIDQLHALLHGDINSLSYSLVIPATVVLSSLLAANFSYANPGWVGLTVIYVANSDHTLELRRILDRIIGTVIGTIVSFLILSFIHLPLRIALFVGVFAFFMPFALKHYMVFSFLITCVVLLLVDIAMFSHGGDMGLLLWRGVDTIFGCACVTVPNLVFQYLGWRKKRHAPGKNP